MLDPTHTLDVLFKKLVSDVEARTANELFLYVNHAVIAWPGWLDYFYKENRGKARVTIQPL